ncbi:hypothetical protein D3C72_1093090 [compost metagenome]
MALQQAVAGVTYQCDGGDHGPGHVALGRRLLGQAPEGGRGTRAGQRTHGGTHGLHEGLVRELGFLAQAHQQHAGGANPGHFVQHQLGAALAFEVALLDQTRHQPLGGDIQGLGHARQALALEQANHQAVGLRGQETILAGFAPIQGFCAKFHRASFRGSSKRKAPLSAIFIRDLPPPIRHADSPRSCQSLGPRYIARSGRQPEAIPHDLSTSPATRARLHRRRGVPGDADFHAHVARDPHPGDGRQWQGQPQRRADADRPGHDRLPLDPAVGHAVHLHADRPDPLVQGLRDGGVVLGRYLPARPDQAGAPVRRAVLCHGAAAGHVRVAVGQPAEQPVPRPLPAARRAVDDRLGPFHRAGQRQLRTVHRGYRRGHEVRAQRLRGQCRGRQDRRGAVPPGPVPDHAERRPSGGDGTRPALRRHAGPARLPHPGIRPLRRQGGQQAARERERRAAQGPQHAGPDPQSHP